MNEEEPLTYCVYYFVTFDHGLREMARAFSWRMNDNEDSPMTIELLIGDKEHLKTFITDFLCENNSPCRFAYLLYAVRDFLFHDAHKGSCQGKRPEVERMRTIGNRKQRFAFTVRKEYVFRLQRRKDTINN